ncbi:hypothetical protein AMC87_CH00647 [Rhizobium phaseoli]|uniref:DoxX family protein n=1 Tax=Rhizobium phaseoli TaxID=396 RepID=UPI0007EB0B40|nr:DoxX family protein [Rhizobium phaseoli]ANL45379.1 hypothetical protein AMC87_CH00647 [Rhizobium phaseoli]
MHSTSASSADRNKTAKIISWSLRSLAAAAFLAAGSAKLAGVPMMVAIFDQIGAGQWFRILTGAVEVTAIALLIPATAAFGALLLTVTMVFAVLTHLFVIGGSPVPAIILLLITGSIAWMHRRAFAIILDAIR